jgi:16S rRNA (guanine966-N2)-methyltransferase
MRISGGKARGIPLKVSKKGDVRPAIETTRERLFSSIFQSVENATVLDLFAGSGAYGLESLSRGAKQATLVEKNRLVFNDLKTNLAAVLKSANLQGEAGKLVNRDVLDFVKEPPSQNYDIIFIDPPYAEIEKLGPRLFELLLRNHCLSKDGFIVLETPGELKMEFPGWIVTRVVGKEKRGSPVHRIYSPAHPLPGQ